MDFEAPEEAGRAIREKDHKVFSDKFGDRYVRLIQVCTTLHASSIGVGMLPPLRALLLEQGTFL